MDSVKPNSSGDISFFAPEQDKLSLNPLRDFIHYLSFNRFPRPYKFSYIDEKAALIPNLSLRQNIALNGHCQGLLRSPEEYLAELLTNPTNEWTGEIIEAIGCLDSLPSDVSIAKRKLAALLKVSLEDSPMLFLISPEKHLDGDSFQVLRRSLEKIVKQTSKSIYIYSGDKPLWMTICGKVISRDEQKRFIIKQLAHHSIADHFLHNPTPAANTSLIKQPEGLVIHDETQKIKKAS
jgi:ABC-type lipoprotein export system ATPase subunit